MAGGLQPPEEEEDPAVTYAAKGGVYFVLEDADLQVAKVGKVQTRFGLYKSKHILSGPRLV